MDYVFIIGTARTGSKIYMNLLNEYSEINIVGELGFLDKFPNKIRNNVKSTIKSKIGNIEDESDIDKLIELFYSGDLDSTFWNSENGIHSINKEDLKNRILESDKSYKKIFSIIIEEHTKSKNKEIPGAKFPVRIHCVPTLMDWFPEAKYIHLVRDPRAIYPSSVLHQMEYLSKNNIPTAKPLQKIFTLFNLVNSYNKSYEIYDKYNSLDNYLLLRFEDVVSSPEKYLEKMCSFLNIEFKDEMLYPPRTDSSYDRENSKNGFDKKALTRWKNNISPMMETLIKKLLKKEMEDFGYV